MWPTHYIPNQPRLDSTPPPRLYLTTPPYPIEVIEQLASASVYVVASFGLGAEDELESAASFVGGEIIQYGYTDANAGRDELESAAVFVGGVLALQPVITIDAGIDELESAAVFVSGVLATVPIIDYNNWPLGATTEDLLSAAAFVSGELT